MISGRQLIIFYTSLGILVIGIALVIIMMVLSSTKKISTSSSFFCIVLGILLICVSITIRASIQIFNMRNKRNRYPMAYNFMQNQLEQFITEEQINKIDKEFDEKDTTGTTATDVKKQVFIFLQQCMSFYFGDKDWYANKDKNENSKIKNIDINKDGTEITVYFKDNNTKDYANVKNIELKKPVNSPVPVASGV